MLYCVFPFSPPGVTGGPLRCRLDLQYASVGSDELVLLQDKLLLPNTQTTLNSLTSTNGKISTIRQKNEQSVPSYWKV